MVLAKNLLLVVINVLKKMVDSTEIVPLQEISTFVCVLNRVLVKEHQSALFIAKNKRWIIGK